MLKAIENKLWTDEELMSLPQDGNTYEPADLFAELNL